MILGIIPARGGSKGIPMKALHPLKGKPLIRYTIEAALESDLDDVVLTTDSDEIAKTYWNVIRRPAELAQDDTPMMPVIQHALSEYEKTHRVDAVMLLQPTSPLRTAQDINTCLEIFRKPDKDGHMPECVVSVCWGVHPIKSYWLDPLGLPRPFWKQVPYDKRKHRCLTRNGAIFLTSKQSVLDGRLIGKRPVLYIMPKSRSVDIDDMEDLRIAEALLK